jgi:hypothetical protein
MLGGVCKMQQACNTRLPIPFAKLKAVIAGN